MISFIASCFSAKLAVYCYLTDVLLSLSAQGQADYSAAWAAYYQQFYQQQAAAAAGQPAPGTITETIF